MNRKILIILPAILLAACNDNGTTVVASAEKTDKQIAAKPVGKLSAPVEIEYTVLGTAIVGQPVAIELRLSSTLRNQSIGLSYFINDADSLMLGASQPSDITLSIPGDSGVAARQVTVVPQREGRLYLNVTAEVATDNGVMLKSMAIPIPVGPGEDDVEINGELQTTADGETVVSMPARDN